MKFVLKVLMNEGKVTSNNLVKKVDAHKKIKKVSILHLLKFSKKIRLDGNFANSQKGVKDVESTQGRILVNQKTLKMFLIQ